MNNSWILCVSNFAVWKDVKRAAKAFRLSANIAPHSARKNYAAGLLEEYGDIDRVRRALNHSSESVTLIYAIADQQRRAKDKPGCTTRSEKELTSPGRLCYINRTRHGKEIL